MIHINSTHPSTLHLFSLLLWTELWDVDWIRYEIILPVHPWLQIAVPKIQLDESFNCNNSGQLQSLVSFLSPSSSPSSYHCPLNRVTAPDSSSPIQFAVHHYPYLIGRNQRVRFCDRITRSTTNTAWRRDHITIYGTLCGPRRALGQSQDRCRLPPTQWLINPR